MAFCSKCGSELPESGTCSCGYTSPDAAVSTATAPKDEASSTVQPNVVYVKTPPNPIITESIEIIKKSFTPKPQDAVIAATGAKSHIWIVLVALNVLLTALAFMLIPGSLIKSMLGGLGGIASGAINEIMPFGALFGGGLLLALVSFAVLSACVKGVYAIFKLDVSFVKVMNLVSSSLLIASMGTAGAIVFSFIYAPLSLVLIAVGILGSVVMLYTGIQRAASFTSSPFWFFLCVYAVDIIVVSFVGGQTVSSILGEALGSAMSGLGSLSSLNW